MGNTIIDVINPIDLKSRRKQIEKLIKQLEEHKRKGDLDKSTYDKIITEVLPEYGLKSELENFKSNLKTSLNESGDDIFPAVFYNTNMKIKEEKSPIYYLTQASRCFNDQSKYKWYEITSEDKYKEYMKTSYAYITNNDYTKIREPRYEGLSSDGFDLSNLIDFDSIQEYAKNKIDKSTEPDMLTSDFSYENVFNKLKDVANHTIDDTKLLDGVSMINSLNSDPISIQTIVNKYADNNILDKVGYILNLIKVLNIMANKIRSIIYDTYRIHNIIDLDETGSFKKLAYKLDLKNKNDFEKCDFMNEIGKVVEETFEEKLSREDLDKLLGISLDTIGSDINKNNKKYVNLYGKIYDSIFIKIKNNNKWYSPYIFRTLDNKTSINDSIKYLREEMTNIYDDSGLLPNNKFILNQINYIVDEELYKSIYKNDTGYSETNNTMIGVELCYLSVIGLFINLLKRNPTNISRITNSNTFINIVLPFFINKMNNSTKEETDENPIIKLFRKIILENSSDTGDYTTLGDMLTFVLRFGLILGNDNISNSKYINEYDISENTITFTKPGTYLIKYDTIQFNLYSIVDYIFNYIDKNNIDSDYENWTKEYSELKKDKNVNKKLKSMKIVSNGILSRDNIINKKFLINLVNKLNVKQKDRNSRYQIYKEYFKKYIKIYSRDPYRYRYINEIFNKMIHKLINVEQKYNIDTNQYEYYFNIYTNFPHKPTEKDLKDKSEEEKQNIINKYNESIKEKQNILKLQERIIIKGKIAKKYILVEYDGKTVTKIPDLNIIPDKDNMGRYNKAYFYDIFNNKVNDNTKIIIREIPLGDKNPDDNTLESSYYVNTNTAIGGTNSLYNRDMIYKNNLDDNKLGFMTTQINTYHFFDSDIYFKSNDYGGVYLNHENAASFDDNYKPGGVYKLMTDISIIPISDKYGIKFDTVNDSKLIHSYVEYNETNRILPTFDEDYSRIRDYINDKKFDFRLNCLLAKPEFNGNNKLTSYDYERLLRDYAMIYNYPYNYTPMNQDDKMFLDSYSKNPICIFRTTKTEFESTKIYQKGNLLYSGDYPLDIFRNKNYEPNIDIKYSDIDYLFNNKLFKDGIFSRGILPEYLKNLGYLEKLLLFSFINYFNFTALINDDTKLTTYAMLLYDIIGLTYLGATYQVNCFKYFNYRKLYNIPFTGMLSEKTLFTNNNNKIKDSNINKYYNLRAYSIYNKDNKQKLIIRNVLDDPYNTKYDSKLANEVLIKNNSDDLYNMSELSYLQDYYWDIYKKADDKVGLYDYTRFASSDKFDTVNLLYGENIQKIIQDYKLEFTPSKENLSKILKCIESLDKMSIKEYKKKYGLTNNHELVVDVTPTKNILDDVTATIKVTTSKNDKHTFLLKRTGVPTQEIPTPTPTPAPEPAIDKSELQKFIDVMGDEIDNETYRQSDPETRDLFDSVYELCNRINDDFDVCQNYYGYSIAKDELLTKINDKIESTPSSDTYTLAVLVNAFKGCDIITETLKQCPSSPAISGKTNSNDNSTWNEDMKYILSTPVIKDISMYKIMKPLYTNGNDPYISTYHVYFNKEDIFGSIYNLYTGQLKETDKPSPCKDLSLSYIPVKNTYLSMEQRLWELAYNDARLKMLTMRVFLDSIHNISDKEKEKYETDFWKLYTSGNFEITIKNVEYTPLPDGYKEYLYILLKDNKIGKKTMDMKNNYTNNEEYNNAVKAIYDKFIKKLKDKKIYDKHIEQVRKLLSPYAIAYEISDGDKELTNKELEKIEFLIWRNYIVDRRFYHEGNPLSGQKDPYMLDYKKLAEIIDNIKDGSENPDPTINYKGLRGTFGIERYINDYSTTWRRIGDSANFRATPTKRKESLDTYYSDFDKYYPWSEMKRIYKDGDVLVFVPPFYYRRYQDDKIERIEISSGKKDGFELHPGSGVYVGAYLVDESTGNHSVRGKKPMHGKTRGEFRSKIRERGSNYWMYDVKTDMALKILYLVEYAENNTQRLLQATYRVYEGEYYTSGIGDDLGNKTGCLSNYMGNYRGIEGLLNGAEYGCEFIDGLIANYDTYFISKDPNDYSDDHSATSYNSLSYKIAQRGYIKKHGYDTSNAWCMLPEVSIGDPAGGDEYFTDYIVRDEYNSNQVSYRRWQSAQSTVGLFFIEIIDLSGSYYFKDKTGARLIRSLDSDHGSISVPDESVSDEYGGGND